MKSLGGLLVAAVLLLIGWRAAQNVFADDPRTLETARVVACEERICTAEVVWRRRTPWNQRMQFLVNESHRTEVLCQHPLWIYGESQCELAHVDDR